VRGQQRNQQRAASALQDRLQELEQGGGAPLISSSQSEEQIQALEGALEEERSVTAVLLGRLIDNDAKIQVCKCPSSTATRQLDPCGCDEGLQSYLHT
jgi:hypothetical protein